MACPYSKPTHRLPPLGIFGMARHIICGARPGCLRLAEYSGFRSFRRVLVERAGRNNSRSAAATYSRYGAAAVRAEPSSEARRGWKIKSSDYVFAFDPRELIRLQIDIRCVGGSGGFPAALTMTMGELRKGRPYFVHKATAEAASGQGARCHNSSRMILFARQSIWCHFRQSTAQNRAHVSHCAWRPPAQRQGLHVKTERFPTVH